MCRWVCNICKFGTRRLQSSCRFWCLWGVPGTPLILRAHYSGPKGELGSMAQEVTGAASRKRLGTTAVKENGPTPISKRPDPTSSSGPRRRAQPVAETGLPSPASPNRPRPHPLQGSSHPTAAHTQAEKDLLDREVGQAEAATRPRRGGNVWQTAAGARRPGWPPPQRATLVPSRPWGNEGPPLPLLCPTAWQAKGKGRLLHG